MSSSAPAAASSSSAPAAAASSSAAAAADQYEVVQFQIMGSRERSGGHKCKTQGNFIPMKSVETAGVRPQVLQRQPESTTEELEDVGQGHAAADTKMLAAVCEEPVIAIGLDGETLAESEADELQKEESDIDDVNEGFFDPDVVRTARLGELPGCPCVVVSRLVSVVFVKGDERSPDVRTDEESANFFASTPPLQAVKFLISEAMTKRVSRKNRPLKLSFIGVNRHMCAAKC